MSGRDFFHTLSFSLIVLLVIVTCISVIQAIRRDPKDRVLIFEVIAFVIFFFGAWLVKMVGVSLISAVGWLVAFLGWSCFVGIFSLRTWRRQRK